MGARLMAIVARRGSRSHLSRADRNRGGCRREAETGVETGYDLPSNPRDFQPPSYGMTTLPTSSPPANWWR